MVRVHAIPPRRDTGGSGTVMWLQEGDAQVGSGRKRQRYRREEGTGSESFFVADSAPLIRYGDGQTSTWTAGYALQADGYDQTLHLTSERETIAFNTTATALTLLIPSFSQCAATISINSSSPIAACATKASTGDIPFSLYNLPVGTHDIRWDSGDVVAGEQIIFWGFEAQRPESVKGMTNVTIDDTFSSEGGVSYTWQGDWTKSAGVETNVMDFNQTLSSTSKLGASVTFKAAGSAVYLYGSVGPQHGSASVALNGQLVAPMMNLTSPWEMAYQLLWFDTGLDTSEPFTVELKSLEEKKMTLDFVVLTTDSDTLADLNVFGKSSSFVTSLTGKLVLYLVVPLLACLLLGSAIWYTCRRRRRSQQSRRDSSQSVEEYHARQPRQTESEFGFDKRESGGVWSSGHSDAASVEEIFVSYDQGRSQRLSDRWYSSPTSTTTPTGLSPSRSPARSTRSQRSQRSQHSQTAYSQRTLPALPEGQSTAGSPTAEEGTAGSWSRPLRSLLGSSYARSEGSQAARRETDLPPYTPGLNGTYIPEGNHSGSTGYPSATEEKAAQLLYAMGHRVDTTRRDDAEEGGSSIAGPSNSSQHPRDSTAIDSEVMSVFGAPPSERRESAMTAWSGVPNRPKLPSQYSHPSYPSTTYPTQSRIPVSFPTPPARPTVITDFYAQNSNKPLSAIQSAGQSASTIAHSATPFLDSPEARRDRAGISPARSARSGRSERSEKSGLGGRSAMSASQSDGGSTARPDSDLIPFKAFLDAVETGR